MAGWPVYGEASANDSNVQFPFDQMSPAAHDLWKMSDEIQKAAKQLSDAVETVTVDWTGPEFRTFTTKTGNFATSATRVVTALDHLSRELADAWAKARGQQDRINTARWAEQEIARLEADRASSDNPLEWIGDRAGEVKDWFVGSKEFPMPDNPAIPGSPAFRPTRDPIRPSYGI